MKNFLKKGDILILVLALAVCALLFLPKVLGRNDTLKALVYENGKITHEIPLSDIRKEYKIEINGAVLLVEKGCISYVSATCPDKTCVKTGKLTRVGDTAACVPGKTVVTVVHGEENTVDVITY